MKNIITKDDLIGNFIKTHNSDVLWMPLEFYDKGITNGYKFLYIKDHRYFGRIGWATLELTLDCLNNGHYKLIRLDGKK